LKVFSFFLALGCAKISYNPQKSKVYTFSADPKYQINLNSTTMKKTLLSLSLILTSFFATSQSLDTTFTSSDTFTSGTLNPNGYDDTLYLNPGESININVSAMPTAYAVFTQLNVNGVPTGQLFQYPDGLPYSYTFQTGFQNFGIFITYQSNSVASYMYKILVVNNENQQTNSVSESDIVDFNLYPNPTSHFLTVKTDYIGEYQILDLSGRILFTTTEKQIDLSSLSAGQYFIKAGENCQKIILE
jgi:hypothetical protein